MTARALAAAAGVQEPTIYRLFGEKQGRLDAVAQHGLAAYVASKVARKVSADPALLDQHAGNGKRQVAMDRFEREALDQLRRPRSIDCHAAELHALVGERACGTARGP